MKLVGNFSNYKIIVFIIILNSLNGGSQPVTLSGYVREFESRKPIPNVNIWNTKYNLNTYTNNIGYYSLDFTDTGYYYINFKNIKYRKILKRIRVYKNGQVLNVEMIPDVIEFSGVIVEGKSHSTMHSNLKITSRTIKNFPALGEPDIIASFRTLPGIYTTNDLKGGFYVRAGRNGHYYLGTGIHI